MAESQTSPEIQENWFVKCPYSLLIDTGLSNAALRLYLIIKSYFRTDKSECYAKYRTLAAQLGCKERRIQDLVHELESKGYLLVEHRQGLTSLYWPQQKIAGVISDNPSKKLLGTPAKNDRPPQQKIAYKLDVIKKNKEIDCSKKPKKPKSDPPKDPVVIQQKLDKINLANIRKKWGNKIDVESVISKFFDQAINGDPWNEEPNPRGYTNFALALQSWCYNEPKWNPQKTTHLAQTPVLRNLDESPYLEEKLQ